MDDDNIERVIRIRAIEVEVTERRIGPKPVPPKTRLVGPTIDVTPRPVLRLVRKAA